MKSGFYKNIKLATVELDELKQIVRISHEAPWIYESIEGLHTSKSARLCGIYASDSLASFAWYMQRTWIINGISFRGLSIGIVTTAPDHRCRGFARQLIFAIEELAKQKKIDFIYLAGIPGFYDKYGFRGFAPKSKIVFKKSDLPKSSGTIAHLKVEDWEKISRMHAAYSETVSSKSIRSTHEWNDLLGPLSSTFVFNQPRLVLDENSSPIAYYCSTPGDASLIREFVPLIDSISALKALAIIANSVDQSHQEKVEIFSPASGPVWETAANSIGADFLCFLRPRSSNMIKWVSTTKPPNDIYWSFMLQGDIL